MATRGGSLRSCTVSVLEQQAVSSSSATFGEGVLFLLMRYQAAGEAHTWGTGQPALPSC